MGAEQGEGVGAHHGDGALIGIHLAAPVAAEVRAAAHERGLIVNAPTADTIRIAPAYTIGDDEVEEFVVRFGAALSAVAETVQAPTATTLTEASA